MAGAGYDVDPAVLKAQGGAFKEIGSDFSAAAKKLAATLKEAEDWGDDDPINYATTERDQHDHLAKYAASRPKFAN
ncbi:hypothetical protein ACIGT4_20050 [Streptomyces sioyaensis]|uniref:hypothetical protein n=1 Tax=Streptomyces sioyaensis TaxID=67364 RepID=UPI0037D66CA2